MKEVDFVVTCRVEDEADVQELRRQVLNSLGMNFVPVTKVEQSSLRWGDIGPFPGEN